MARTTLRPPPTAAHTLQPLGRHCPLCGETMWAAYHNYRTITTLEDVLQLTLQIRRCLNQTCPQFRRPYRPEAEGRLALPRHEFSLDVIAWVGTLRDAQHRSLPEIHQHLLQRGVAVAPRTVRHLLERYDALRTLLLTDTTRLQRITQARGRVIRALDGLQPDVGHEVLWVLRDCLSGAVPLARSLLSATQANLAVLLRTVYQTVRVPIVGIIVLLSDSMKNNPFLRLHAVQSLALGVVLFIVTLVISFTGIGACLAPFLWLGVTLYYAYQAYQGKNFSIPFVTDFCRNQKWI